MERKGKNSGTGHVINSRTQTKLSSPLQGATMKFLAEHQRAKRSIRDPFASY